MESGEEDIKPGGKTCVYSRDIKSVGLKLEDKIVSLSRQEKSEGRNRKLFLNDVEIPELRKELNIKSRHA